MALVRWTRPALETFLARQGHETCIDPRFAARTGIWLVSEPGPWGAHDFNPLRHSPGFPDVTILDPEPGLGWLVCVENWDDYRILPPSARLCDKFTRDHRRVGLGISSAAGEGTTIVVLQIIYAVRHRFSSVQFSLEFSESADEILDLLDAIVQVCGPAHPFVAQVPAEAGKALDFTRVPPSVQLCFKEARAEVTFEDHRMHIRPNHLASRLRVEWANFAGGRRSLETLVTGALADKTGQTPAAKHFRNETLSDRRILELVALFMGCNKQS